MTTYEKEIVRSLITSGLHVRRAITYMIIERENRDYDKFIEKCRQVFLQEARP